MKKYLFFATVALALVSCSDNAFTGDSELGVANGNSPISFSFDVPMPTRAEGSEAATKLNNQFIVWGEKGETSGSAAVTDGSTSHQLVFRNYKVTYGDNTAYTTTSNTKDWEYVGITPYASNVTPATGETTQTIKYWDYAAGSYTFTAISAKPADITDGRVTIAKTTSGTTVYDKGYTVTVTDMADLTSLYFADRQSITDASNTDRTVSNKYGGSVKFTFRNAITQVRVGMYETIPGYTVKVTKFYYDDDADPATFDAMDQNNTTNFVANVPNVSPAAGKTAIAGTFTVKYYSNSAANEAAGIVNHPTVTFAPTTASDAKHYITLGTGVVNTVLSETSATPTYDKTAGAYTTVMPQETNAVNLKLKIDYQLTNTITGETINITGKTAEVPAEYLQWKPNFKYTYIFKVNDNDLYPITFDAMVVEDATGNVEYITTVSEPSITTYAKGSAVTTNGEYAASEKVYAVVEDGSSLATLSASNMKLYEVTTADATNFPITEASVAEAIAEYPIMSTAEQTAAKIKFTASSFSYGKTIIAEDGSIVTMDASNNVVADFTTAAGKVYAIEYIKTAATYGNDGGKTYTEVEFAAAGTLYKEAACTNVADATYYASHTSDTYYKKTHVTAVGTYAYKIVRVGGATGEVTP